MLNIMEKRIIPLLIVAALLAALTACTGGRIPGNSDGNKPIVNDDGNQTGVADAATKPTEKSVKITETAAKAAQTELYECADFSITIPKGWKVTAGGVNIYHSIRVYDPNEPVNQMFIQLKAEPFLHCEEGKAGWQYNCYTMGNAMLAFLADAPVMKNPSTEGFFQIQPQCIDNISRDLSYAGYTFPRFENFTVTERFASTSGMKGYALGDELLRATFTDNGKEGEGLFSASVVDFGATPVSTGRMNGYLLETVDGGYYMVYNIMAVTAVKDTFIEWESLLTKSYNYNLYIKVNSKGWEEGWDFGPNTKLKINGKEVSFTYIYDDPDDIYTFGVTTGITMTPTAAGASGQTEGDKTDTTSPQTGDNSNLALWLTVLFVSCGGVIGGTIYGRKKKHSAK